jgi:hypothetical protein
VAHQIEVKLKSFSDDEHHKVQNFVEDLWRSLEQSGWVSQEDFDHRINPGAVFRFSFPARQSHEARTLVDRTVRQHFMEPFVTVTHLKKAEHG